MLFCLGLFAGLQIEKSQARETFKKQIEAVQHSGLEMKMLCITSPTVIPRSDLDAWRMKARACLASGIDEAAVEHFEDRLGQLPVGTS